MVVKLSSKGQLVVPKEIREALALQPGAEFNVELVAGRIILRPVVDKEQAYQAIDRLYGMFSDADLLSALEDEHKWEIERESHREQSLRT